MSDGVVILPSPPNPQLITDATLIANGMTVVLEWFSFTDRYIEGSDFMESYEVSIYALHDNQELESFTDWTKLSSDEISMTENRVIYTTYVFLILFS